MYKFIQYTGDVDSKRLKKKIKFLEPLSIKDLSNIKKDIFKDFNYEEYEQYPYKMYKFTMGNDNFICLGG